MLIFTHHFHSNYLLSMAYAAFHFLSFLIILPSSIPEKKAGFP